VPAFNYVVLDERGREKKGTLEGDSARQVRQQLRDKGLIPLSVDITVKRSSVKGGDGFRAQSRQRLTSNDLALLTRQLATLIQASLPVEEALRAVAKQTEKPKIKSMVLSIRSKVVEGYTLAKSLGEYPHAFPHLYRATVEAGEHSGHLDLVLEQLADYTESSAETSKKIKGALIYPIVITIFSFSIVVLLLKFVVPKMVSVFEGSGQALPSVTVALISTSEFIQAYGFYIFIGMAIGIFLFMRGMRRESFRRRVHAWLLKLPLIGRIVKGVDAARVASTLCILAKSGVQLVEALKIASQVTANICIRDAVRQGAEMLREGSSLHRALDQSGHFPPMMVQMIASGEQSGELDNMLGRAARNQERELESIIGTIISLFEPLMMVFMGVVVMVIVLAIMLPIISMNNLVG